MTFVGKIYYHNDTDYRYRSNAVPYLLGYKTVLSTPKKTPKNLDLSNIDLDFLDFFRKREDHLISEFHD